jgi:dihydropteroate synthase
MNSALPVPLEWRTARRSVRLGRPVVMGILNVTPDSFWDGGRHAGLDDAVRHAALLIEEGADILDVGGESTRPGARPVAVPAEAARVTPVVEALAREFADVLISVDTTKADVARQAIDAGAAIINDVSGLRLDPAIAAVAAANGAGLVLMHSRGDVADMARYEQADYSADCVADVTSELQGSIAAALAAGVADGAIVVDPGLGFSKRTEHSLAMLAGLQRIASLGYPVLVGPSRKRFVGDSAGGLPPDQRLEGTIAACVIAFMNGASLFRVHDVRAARRALDLAAAVRDTAAVRHAGAA